MPPEAYYPAVTTGGCDLIAHDPAVMGGLPIISGTRIPVRTLHARVMGGDTIESILVDYPYISREAVAAAVDYVEASRAGRSQ